MSYDINTIRNNLGDLARPNKYKVTIPELGGDEISVLIKAASLPGRAIGQVEAYAQGRKIPIAGDTTYENWNVTFYMPVNHEARKKIEDWIESIDSFKDNKSEKANLADYGKEMKVEQLDRTGSTVATYTFHNAWVNNVAEVSLGADTNDSIEEFECTISYTFYELAT